MPSKQAEDITDFCKGCRQMFSYRASLPHQTHCRECYLADKGDFTGAMQEVAWKTGYREGVAVALEPLYRRVETLSKLLETLPLRDLIALCHPDRHPQERAQKAHETTSVLLDLQRAVRELEDQRAA